MKIIDITDNTNVELWPGRRLYIGGDSLVTLPKGSMSRLGRTISFGSATRTSCQLVGSADKIDAVFTAIVSAEAPNEGVVRL